MKHIFIINPNAGLTDKTEEIRTLLSKRTDVESIIFNTEEAEHESSIMKEMLDIFDDENVRICVCGGSGTLSNALDAIDVNDMEHLELAFYPCGLTNDFLKNFTTSGRGFEDLNAIIDGKTKKVDYLRCVVDGNDHNVRNELLFVTVGIAANIEKTARLVKFLGGFSPVVMYGLATILTAPFSAAADYEVIIDGEDYSREYKLVYVGNGVCMGGAFVPIKDGISCHDGYINVLLLKRIPPFKILNYLTEFMHGTLTDKRDADAVQLKCKEIFIRRKDGRTMNVNSDGEIFSSYSWHIKVVNNRLNLVVPNGTEFIEGTDEVVKCLGLC